MYRVTIRRSSRGFPLVVAGDSISALALTDVTFEDNGASVLIQDESSSPRYVWRNVSASLAVMHHGVPGMLLPVSLRHS
jgi:hypothetical protein